MGFSDTCADLCRSIEQGYDTRLCVGKFIERLRKEELFRYHPEVINCLIKLAEEYLAKPCYATLVPLIVSTETTRAFLESRLVVEDGRVHETFSRIKQ